MSFHVVSCYIVLIRFDEVSTHASVCDKRPDYLHKNKINIFVKKQHETFPKLISVDALLGSLAIKKLVQNLLRGRVNVNYTR